MARRPRPATRLLPPTPAQQRCAHEWEITHTRSSMRHWFVPWPRRRYGRCRRCGLKVRTVENIDVPWAIHHDWDDEELDAALRTQGWPGRVR